jgi:hypothetical protein
VGGNAMMMGSRKYRRRSTDETGSARCAALGLVGRRKWMFYDEDLCSLFFSLQIHVRRG